MPPASCPSAVSFSDCWSWASTSRCTVMSRTMAMSPAISPPRPRTADSVTARDMGRAPSRATLTSKACMAEPRVSRLRASA